MSLPDQPPRPGHVTAIRDGQYATEERAPGPVMAETDEKDVPVACDDEECRAIEDPQTPPELWAALEHWEHHEYLSGCSHGH